MDKNYSKELRELPKEHEYFIGIDSDGCVFDSMELKHKECFCPNVIKYFDLQAISKYTRQVWDFVNLYSVYRGINRFPALVKTIEILSKRKEVHNIGVEIPDTSELSEWIGTGAKLSNNSLQKYIQKNDGKNLLKKVLEWSHAVNDDISEMVKKLPPFPYAVKSFEKINNKADAIVVSQTPNEALEREWNEHGITKYVKAIAGQEYGKKSQHIKDAASEKYEYNKILMIGDSPGDFKAAEANNAFFFPIIPGEENESWKTFYNETIDIFLSGKFTKTYQSALIEDFYKVLPKLPAWKS